MYLLQLIVALTRRCVHKAFDQAIEMTPPPIRMDWSFSLKDEIWSLRMIHQNPYELFYSTLRQDMKCDRSESVSQMSILHVKQYVAGM
jgi:hypothetical protein